jgi:SAM-dependent methyltransferase
MNPTRLGHHSFDEYANIYDEALNRGLSVSGEDSTYFARGRIDWTTRRLKELGASPRAGADFGCGAGASLEFLKNGLGLHTLIGLDVSEGLLDVARRRLAVRKVSGVSLSTLSAFQPSADLDIIYCNGVIHHVAPEERDDLLGYVYSMLQPGGYFALWENNPFNPGTRFVMSRIPFDKDADPISHRRASRLLEQAGFEIVRLDFLFVFPRFLKALRILEAPLSPLPLGAQYMVLARRR